MTRETAWRRGGDTNTRCQRGSELAERRPELAPFASEQIAIKPTEKIVAFRSDGARLFPRPSESRTERVVLRKIDWLPTAR